VLINDQWIDPAVFTGVTTLPVSQREPFAANALRVRDTLIFPASYPETSERLRACGFDLEEVDVSELEKAEAGLTCMSLLVEPID
jgi:dimethylargininase